MIRSAWIPLLWKMRYSKVKVIIDKTLFDGMARHNRAWDKCDLMTWNERELHFSSSTSTQSDTDKKINRSLSRFVSCWLIVSAKLWRFVVVGSQAGTRGSIKTIAAFRSVRKFEQKKSERSNKVHFTFEESVVLLRPIDSCGKLDLLCGGFSFELKWTKASFNEDRSKALTSNNRTFSRAAQFKAWT